MVIRNFVLSCLTFLLAVYLLLLTAALGFWIWDNWITDVSSEFSLVLFNPLGLIGYFNGYHTPLLILAFGPLLIFFIVFGLLNLSSRRYLYLAYSLILLTLQFPVLYYMSRTLYEPKHMPLLTAFAISNLGFIALFVPFLSWLEQKYTTYNTG